MKLQLKYDINVVCKKVLEEQLDHLGLQYKLGGLGEVEVSDTISLQQHTQLNNALKKYGIEILDNHKSVLVQKTKDAIQEMLYKDSGLPTSKISSYLAEKLNHRYGYLTNLFSEVTFTSIENYIILQKIERVKQLIIADQLTLTEISYKMNYSSVAHLSAQFKKTTGINPSAFQRIIKKRRAHIQGKVAEPAI